MCAQQHRRKAYLGISRAAGAAYRVQRGERQKNIISARARNGMVKWRRRAAQSAAPASGKTRWRQK